MKLKVGERARLFLDQTGQVEASLDKSGIFSSLNHPPSTLDLSGQPEAGLTCGCPLFKHVTATFTLDRMATLVNISGFSAAGGSAES